MPSFVSTVIGGNGKLERKRAQFEQREGGQPKDLKLTYLYQQLQGKDLVVTFSLHSAVNVPR